MVLADVIEISEAGCLGDIALAEIVIRIFQFFNSLVSFVSVERMVQRDYASTFPRRFLCATKF